MSETFDPYYEWLGIRPEEHPVDLYRLLGIGALEDNVTAIENAADRQMGHLRKFQTGKHSALSQKLLNEVAAARVCLLSPARKAAYDRKLREKIEAAAPVASAGSDSFDPGLAGLVESLQKERQPAKMTQAMKPVARTPRGRKGPPLVGMAVAGLAALLAVLGISTLIGNKPDANTPVAKGPDKRPQNSAASSVTRSGSSSTPASGRMNAGVTKVSAPRNQLPPQCAWSMC